MRRVLKRWLVAINRSTVCQCHRCSHVSVSVLPASGTLLEGFCGLVVQPDSLLRP